jgi:tetratricopeptide (TPR) repeat protein
LTEAESVLRVLPTQQGGWFRKAVIQDVTAHEIEWTARNALGMALMYYSDYFPAPDTPNSKETRINDVRRAIDELDKADRLNAFNWANYCDMGSARMRLAYYLESSELFEDATRFLRTVTSRLRPNYGFAIYELGRISRLRGDFETALKLFDEALKIPDTERGMSDRRPKKERERAQKRDKSFP